jgi:outer membrane protein insertion porin family
LRVSGVEEKTAAAIRSGLSLTGKSKLIGRERATLYEETLLDDISRIRLYLARHGYPYSSVTPAYSPNRGARTLELTLEISPGPPVIAAGVGVNGVPTSLQREAAECLMLRPGSIFREDLLNETALQLKSKLRHAGYANAEIIPAIERVDSTNVRLLFETRAGEVHHFAGVRVDGAPADLVPLVKKTINLRIGSTYSPATVQEAQDYLRLLDLFGRIRLSTVEAGPRALDVMAELTPRKPRSMEVNVGYWTDEQIKVGARWRHRNLFRRGRGLEVKGSYSRFQRLAGLSAGWPGFFGPRTWGAAGTDIEMHREDSYDLDSVELEMSGTYRPSLLTSIRVGISVSDVTVDVKTDEAQAFLEEGGLLTYFSAGWNRDSSDDRLFPTRGTVTWLQAEWAPGYLSEAQYASITGAVSAYAPLGRGLVAAARMRAGLAEPIGESDDLLPNKRFFAGGATSMRGFKRRKLGPLDNEGAPLGGESKLEATLELRFPILGRIGGAAFVDAGQVWTGDNAFALDELEVAAGPGLVIRTPIGPIRGDIGFRLTDLDGDQPSQVYHISIGHPF